MVVPRILRCQRKPAEGEHEGRGETGGVWSIARGLARNESAYKKELTTCDREVMVSASTRAPLRLAFPATLAPRWMPGLFPEQAA